MLSPDQLKQLKAALSEREHHLRGEVRRAIHEKFGRDLPELEDTGDESSQSVADLLDDIDTGMMMRDVDELLAIESARGAIKGGSYGDCTVCGAPIDFRRLIALPTATRCLACQELHERTTWKPPEMKL